MSIRVVHGVFLFSFFFSVDGGAAICVVTRVCAFQKEEILSALHCLSELPLTEEAILFFVRQKSKHIFLKDKTSKILP